MKMTVEVKYRVDLIESERGWGQNLWDSEDFDSLEDAKKFTKEYNDRNNEVTVPDYYIYATDPYRVIFNQKGDEINF
jgi:hypothetical protein